MRQKIWIAEAMRGVDDDPSVDGIYAVGTEHCSVLFHRMRTGHCPVPTPHLDCSGAPMCAPCPGKCGPTHGSAATITKLLPK